MHNCNAPVAELSPRPTLRAPAMRLPLLLSLLILLAFGDATAQPVDTTTVKWYDTLTVTQPRVARVTRSERIALAAYVALSLPVSLVVGGTTLVPPSFIVKREGRNDLMGIAMSSGIAFGGDTMQLTWFPVVRLQGEVAYYFTSTQPTLARLSLLADYRFTSIDRRDFMWLGVAGGAGVSTDFATVSPYAEAFIGLSNPLGIRYIPLFPMHHYGLRLRTGYNLGDGTIWYEAAVAATSTFSL